MSSKPRELEQSVQATAAQYRDVIDCATKRAAAASTDIVWQIDRAINLSRKGGSLPNALGPIRKRFSAYAEVHCVWVKRLEQRDRHQAEKNKNSVFPDIPKSGNDINAFKVLGVPFRIAEQVLTAHEPAVHGKPSPRNNRKAALEAILTLAEFALAATHDADPKAHLIAPAVGLLAYVSAGLGHEAEASSDPMRVAVELFEAIDEIEECVKEIFIGVYQVPVEWTGSADGKLLRSDEDARDDFIVFLDSATAEKPLNQAPAAK